MPHWVYAGIHLYLHLPAIHAYTYGHSDAYRQANAHSETRHNTEGASYPAAATGRAAAIKFGRARPPGAPRLRTLTRHDSAKNIDSRVRSWVET